MSTRNPTSRRITLLIVDDHPMVLTALTQRINQTPGMAVVGQAGSVADAMTFLARRNVDAILLDHRLPDGLGWEVVERVRKMAGHTPTIVMMSAFDDPLLETEAAKLGAHAFVSKATPVDELCHTVITAHRSRTENGSIEDHVSKVEPISLTPREEQVLNLAAHGASNKKIAEQLQISSETVKSHLEKAYSKLSARDRAEAVGKAYRLGLLNRLGGNPTSAG